MFDLILNEAYFGKNNKNLKETEKSIQVIIDIYKSENKFVKSLPVISSASLSKINKELETIQKLIQKEFGFNKTLFFIAHGAPSVNAFVYFNASYKEFDYKVKKDANGIRYKATKMNMICTLFDTLFLGDYTAPEILAVILHEVGHKFYSVNNDIYAAFTILGFLMNPEGSLFRDLIAIPIIELQSKIKDNLRNNKFINSLNTLKANIRNVVDKPLSAIPLLAIPLAYIPDPISFYQGVRNEKFADNFATAYGYGPELNTALMKMKLGKSNFPDSIPFVRTINDIAYGSVKFLISMVDVHPDVYQRAIDNVNYLKAETSSIRDPRLKAEAMEQVKYMEDMIKQYKKDLKIDDAKKLKPVSLIFNTIFIELMDGKSLHSFINKPKNSDWEQFN